MSETGDDLSALLAPEWDPAFFAPDLPIVDSRAWPHLPFLFWLVAALQPRRALYLGVEDGVAFLALCAAAQKFSAPLAFYGLETPPADNDDAAAKALRLFHDRRFAAFSRLTTTPPDEPSLDLLVLDGADAELLARYRPSLTENGAIVILGAGTEHRDLAKAWPADEKFIFDHGEGLLLAGPAAQKFCALPKNQAKLLRQRLGRLGALWAERALGFRLAKQFQNDLPRIRETQNSVLRRFGNSFRKTWRDPGRYFRKARPKS